MHTTHFYGIATPNEGIKPTPAQVKSLNNALRANGLFSILGTGNTEGIVDLNSARDEDMVFYGFDFEESIKNVVTAPGVWELGLTGTFYLIRMEEGKEPTVRKFAIHSDGELEHTFCRMSWTTPDEIGAFV